MNRISKSFTLSLCALLTASAVAQQQSSTENKGKWILWSAGGRSLEILGSEDSRRGGGFAIQWVRKDPRVTRNGVQGLFALEANIFGTEGGGVEGESRDRAVTFGLMAIARYERKPHNRPWSYAEAGFGIQAADKRTHDLTSSVSTTPMLGIGLIFPKGSSEYYLGIRFIHASNGGTQKKNHGQNTIYLMFGVKL